MQVIRAPCRARTRIMRRGTDQTTLGGSSTPQFAAVVCAKRLGLGRTPRGAILSASELHNPPLSAVQFGMASIETHSHHCIAMQRILVANLCYNFCQLSRVRGYVEVDEATDGELFTARTMRDEMKEKKSKSCLVALPFTRNYSSIISVHIIRFLRAEIYFCMIESFPLKVLFFT